MAPTSRGPSAISRFVVRLFSLPAVSPTGFFSFVISSFHRVSRFLSHQCSTLVLPLTKEYTECSLCARATVRVCTTPTCAYMNVCECARMHPIAITVSVCGRVWGTPCSRGGAQVCLCDGRPNVPLPLLLDAGEFRTDAPAATEIRAELSTAIVPSMCADLGVLRITAPRTSLGTHSAPILYSSALLLSLRLLFTSPLPFLCRSRPERRASSLLFLAFVFRSLSLRCLLSLAPSRERELCERGSRRRTIHTAGSQ